MVGAGVEVVRARGEEGVGVVVGDGSSVGVSSGRDRVGPAVVAGGVPQIQVHTGASVVLFLLVVLCYCYKWCCVIVTSHRGQNMRLLCLGLTLNLLVAQEKKERGKWY